ncbi:TetR family transcriptional regulator [Streptomyces venezuelae]|uniref:TetR/AcrR family transcriptional regulator n=1 Tax=Streptomyces gardneri TaxID=66892 RepID=UPI0006BDC63E|nr:TetR/AcrR family transcriptional regulator C-terminal domain-containing protein [Streptomyces gardneri]ALO09787.1 TetR family transcriptional regulator [Streptomyces venezuelae]QPK46849.1 TetR/AcrR family transcriptional regulator C-terminal domain-containing protein [Streptomyces gardneri]WRK38253.1 TetR/AcrR family transcriptional regulator C-terminal domain-containing protein [Streptomyces venezuelae]CUM39778.1 Transcriptional regulator, TetR family [Streptomyces venezuelae]
MVKAADRAKNPARSSVWLEERAARSGGGPAGLDRDRIVATSIRMLDEEGLSKLSMRKLATELGVTAMSLYWYVDTKDDIIEFAMDSVYGEIDLAAVDAAGDWRERIRVLALEYRRMLVRHAWMSPSAGRYLNIGPKAIAVGGKIHDAIRDTGLSLERRPSAMSAVFQFVYGYGTIESQFGRRAADVGMSQDEFYVDAVKAFRDDSEFQARAGDIKELLDERASHGSVSAVWDRDFAYALDVLVAGIEVMVAREAEAARDTEK